MHYSMNWDKHFQEELEEKLKRCPFCGGKARYSEDEYGHDVAECQNCGANVLAHSIEEAIEKWNARFDEECKSFDEITKTLVESARQRFCMAFAWDGATGADTERMILKYALEIYLAQQRRKSDGR